MSMPIRNRPGRTVRVLTAALALLAAACGEPAATGPGAPGPTAVAGPVTDPTPAVALDCDHDPAATIAPDPAAPGPHPVGLRQFEATYATGLDVGARTITVNVWYPAATSDGPPGAYLGSLEDTATVAGAAPAAPEDGCRYPVVAYSHGHLGWAGTGAHMLRAFASHGWVAVAPDHEGNTLTSNIDPRPAYIYAVRPMDVSAALSGLVTLPADDPLAGRVAGDRVVLAGHSFGTYGVWALAGAAYDEAAVDARCGDPEFLAEGCPDAVRERLLGGFHDPRFVAAMTTGGAFRRSWFGAEGHAGVEIPLLDISGSEDGADAEAAAVWPSLEGLEITWVRLDGGCHSSFETSPIGCDSLDRNRGYAAINAYSLAFAQRELLGDERSAVAEILNGQAEVDPAATVQVR